MEKLERWAEHPLSRYDFGNSFEPFALETYQYILYGMGFPTSLEDNSASFHQVELAKRYFAQVETLTVMTVKELPSHRELLNPLQTYRSQKNEHNIIKIGVTHVSQARCSRQRPA